MEKQFIEHLKSTYFDYGNAQLLHALYKALTENNYTYFSKEDGVLLENYLNEQIKQFTKINSPKDMLILNLDKEYINSLSCKDSELYNNFEKSLFEAEEGPKLKLYNIMKEALDKIEDKGSTSERIKASNIIERILSNMINEFSIVLKTHVKNNEVKVKKFNKQAANNCIILSGVKNNNRYETTATIDNGCLNAVSCIGKMRAQQQDAAVIMTHPNNKKIKMLAVCDGMGGMNEGSIISNIVAELMSKWFVQNGTKIFKYDDDEVPEKINYELHTLNNAAKIQLRKNVKSEEPSGSTLVAAIVGEQDTIIINIGDSRAYTIYNDKLTQVTKDQSLAQMLYDNAYKKDIPQMKNDDMRFYKGSNIATGSLGNNSDFTAEVIKIPNKTFDGIILTSDGVTDCLSNAQIQYMSTRLTKADRAKFLVQSANKNNSNRPKYLNNFSEMSEVIPGGKDNMTVVTYDKRR